MIRHVIFCSSFFVRGTLFTVKAGSAVRCTSSLNAALSIDSILVSACAADAPYYFANMERFVNTVPRGAIFCAPLLHLFLSLTPPPPSYPVRCLRCCFRYFAHVSAMRVHVLYKEC
jgi:hypothetical protein